MNQNLRLIYLLITGSCITIEKDLTQKTNRNRYMEFYGSTVIIGI